MRIFLSTHILPTPEGLIVGYQDDSYDQGQQDYGDYGYEQQAQPQYGGAPPGSQPPPVQYTMAPVQRTKEQLIAAIALILMGAFPLIQFAYVLTYSFFDAICFTIYLTVGLPPIIVGILILLGKTGIWIVGLVWAVFNIIWSLVLLLGIFVIAAEYGGFGDAGSAAIIIALSSLPMIFGFMSIFFLIAMNRQQKALMMPPPMYGQPPMYQPPPPGY
jgi:hypothetical protein